MHRFRSLLVVFGLGLGANAMASFYPPGYPVERQCQEQGPVQVCAINQHMGLFPRLEITYKGYLLTKDWGHIQAWIRLNGVAGQFLMKNQDYAEHLALNQPNSHLCLVQAEARRNEPGLYPVCRNVREPDGAVVWEVDPAPEAEQALFRNALDPQGNARPWELEIAFTNGVGAWDSLYSQNYRFVLP